jgi:autotransporter-associated beta strand protein
VINGGTVKTTGAQTYNDPVSIGANTLFESISGGVITFLEALTGNNRSLEIRTAGTSSFKSASGLSSFTKSGSGTLTLTGSSTYTGTTNIAAGTLALGLSNALPTTSALTLSGGTLALNGFSQSLGLLSVTSSSFVSFGSGATLTFANSSAQAWTGTLTISNYNTATNSLRFGSTSSDLTGLQLTSIRFADYGNVFGQIDAAGFITPSAIPEPSTYAAIFGAAALGFAVWRRRRNAE